MHPDQEKLRRRVELLSPAGDRECAYAAFAFGADAVYLGLRKFSARAQAANFSLEELEEVAAFAHQQAPRRRVFVALNTILLQSEISEALEQLALIVRAGADAVIVQDLGAARLCRRYFPELEMHASTQMAVHDAAGAAQLRELGFRRVTLARELTLQEIADISSQSGVETEIFVHGALCYSYSGLCFFSSHACGRSGNRGCCSYPCREVFTLTTAGESFREILRSGKEGLPFSMKDLSFSRRVAELKAVGPSCFKIEGRMKNALYTAAVTDLYRSLLDGEADERRILEKEQAVKTIFSRHWTELYFSSARKQEGLDTRLTGHRGAAAGSVEAVIKGKKGGSYVRFRTSVALQAHDGLQVELEESGRHYGFSAAELRLQQGRVKTYTAGIGEVVDVLLPRGHPFLPAGSRISRTSDQELRKKYKFHVPKPGSYRKRRAVKIRVSGNDRGLTIDALAAGSDSVVARVFAEGRFPAAEETDKVREAFARVLSQWGDTEFFLEKLEFEGTILFLPLSQMKELRRKLVEKLRDSAAAEKEVWMGSLHAKSGEQALACSSSETGIRWSLKIGVAEALRFFPAEELDRVDEIVVDPTVLKNSDLETLIEKAGRDKLRWSLPAVCRSWEKSRMETAIAQLAALGFCKWEASNIGAFFRLKGLDGADIAAGWSLPVLNTTAAETLFDLGASAVMLSPEDSGRNMFELLPVLGPKAVILIYQDTPLFLSEACVIAGFNGGCIGRQGCPGASSELTFVGRFSSRAGAVRVYSFGCRTFVAGEKPFALSKRVDELTRAGARNFRVDLSVGEYSAEETIQLWRRLRSGELLENAHEGNYLRGFCTPCVTCAAQPTRRHVSG